MQSDTSNCGDCGHSCLGGACVQGQCQAAVLGASGINTQNYPARVFYVDGSYVYYSCSGGVTFTRELKTDFSGAGTDLVTGGTFNNFLGSG